VLKGAVERTGDTLANFVADVLDIEDGSLLDGYEQPYTAFTQGFELVPKLAAYLNGESAASGTAVRHQPPAQPVAPNNWMPASEFKLKLGENGVTIKNYKGTAATVNIPAG
jgi:hypothetical protein